MSIQNFFDRCPNVTELVNNFTIRWSRPGLGFGEVVFLIKNGQLTIDTERMNKKFVKDLLCTLVDQAHIEG